MSRLDYRTAGESHGQALIVLVEGLPAGLQIDTQAIDDALRRRRGGYGRGARMSIERDRIQILSGVRAGVTIGSPLAMHLENKDWRIDQAPSVHRPRPGHADYSGAMKYLTTDCRPVLERASARETAARVAAGAVAGLLLREFEIESVGYVVQLGSIRASLPAEPSADDLRAARDANELYCPDLAAADDMKAEIRQAELNKDTVGGVVEVRAFGLPPGLGSCTRWQDRLDGRLAAAVGSIQAFKGVEIGLGFACTSRPGSQVHDEIDYDPNRRKSPNLGFVRRTNHAGGIEGGMTNGMPVVVRGAMKPISTLRRGMDSVNLGSLQPERSDHERSDICAVPAASVVAEHVVAFELARALLEKFGGDTLREVRAAFEFYLATARQLAQGPTDSQDVVDPGSLDGSQST